MKDYEIVEVVCDSTKNVIAIFKGENSLEQAYDRVYNLTIVTLEFLGLEHIDYSEDEYDYCCNYSVVCKDSFGHIVPHEW